MIKLVRSYIGTTPIESCILNAAGCLCTSYDELETLNNSASGAIITKSCTIHPKEGNPHPRVNIQESGSINSVGGSNRGFAYYDQYPAKLDKPYIISIIPSNTEKLSRLLNYHKYNNNLVYEVNLSCPNIIGKKIIAYDFNLFEEYLKIIDKYDVNVGIKLPPFYEDYQFNTISELLLKYNRNVEYISCINSLVNGLLIDCEAESTLIKPKKGFGGIGGSYCKPVALANVRQFYNRLENIIDIIGCGGIKSGQDVFEHILCGATAVQVGTQLINEGPDIFTRLNLELANIMNRKKYKEVEDFKGKLIEI
jgi:dihydroorotate dehydrogenase (fumarate)